MKKSFVSLAIFLGFASMASAGLAKQPSQSKATGKAIAEKEIGEEAAKAVALKKVSGTVKEVEHEKHKGVMVYSVEIVAADGKHEVLVNAVSGMIMEDKLETGHHEQNDDENDDD